MSIYRALGVFLQALGRPAEACVSYHRAARMYTQSRERPYACSALINCVEALLDQGKHVEARAVMGQVDGMLKELDPPPEWLLRDVDVQAARLAALSRLGDQPWLARVVNNTGVFLQALGRPAEAYVAYHRAAALYAQSRERPYACSALINCVDALLDQGKLVEASAVMGQVDGILRNVTMTETHKRP